MPVQANLNSTWVWKWTIFAVVLIGFGIACIYDGAVKYPRDNERFAVYTEYIEQGNRDGWIEHAQQQGWPTDTPTQRSNVDMVSQWVMLGIAWPLGFAALSMLLWFKGRTVAATEEGLVGHRGERIPYDAVTAIDKERWDSKGIAWVHWEIDGQEGRTKIDDFVFRDAWRVLEEVESQTGLGEAVPG